MSLLWMDGFDEYATLADLSQAYTVGSFGAAFSTNAGRFGGGCFQLTNYGAALEKLILGSPTTIYTGVALFPYQGANANSTHAIFTLIGNGGPVCDIIYDYARGVFQAEILTNNANPCVIGQVATLFVPQSWHWVEAYFYVYVTGSEEAGYFQNANIELWVDNVLILNSSGITPATTGDPSTFITNLCLGSIGGPGSNIPFNGNYDDWYISTSARLGDSRIETSVPNSDAGPNDGIPFVSGPHYLMVDELSYSGYDNIELDDAIGQEELFGMAPLVSTPVTIFACRSIAIVAADDDTDVNPIASILVSGGVEIDGGHLVVPMSPPTVLYALQETDPNTSTAWIAAGVNASQVGVKVVSE